MRNPEELTILITGATSGLGHRVAVDFAAKGATLLLHGRDRQRGERLVHELAEVSGNSHLFYFNADLASLAQVNRLADSLAVSQPRIDVLINNAGLGAGPEPKQRQTSVDGFELRFAVNYLAPFLLTRRLLPLLRRGAMEEGEARIVNVASIAQQAIDFADVMLEHGYSGMRAYSQSKLALIMFSFDLAEELAGGGVTVNALHPETLMDTRMVREGFGPARTTVAAGAVHLERLALASELDGVSGRYFDRGVEAQAADQAYDSVARRQLRELSLNWVGLNN